MQSYVMRKYFILNDPVLLRLSEDEFWFSISDSDLLLWMQGVNVAKKFNVEIDEIDVCPLQIQGPLSEDLMAKLAGEELRDVPYYGLMEANINGADCVNKSDRIYRRKRL